MTQTYNYFPTFLVTTFYQPENDKLFQGWGFCVTAAGQPQACLVLPKHFVIPGTLSFLQIRGECSSIPADFVIPSDFVISRPCDPAAFGSGGRRPAPGTLSFSKSDFPTKKF